MGREAYETVWGPLLRGKFGDRADDISMAWLWSKLTLRRRLEGSEAREERLGYPRGSWETLFEALREQIEARGGRVLVDRPVARLARGRTVRGVGRRAGSFRRGHDPRRFDPRRARALRRRHRHRAQRRLRRAARPGLAAEVGDGYLRGCEASSTTPRCACCSSSTAASRRSTGPTWPTGGCRSSA
jgi:hypothetical protein